MNALQSLNPLAPITCSSAAPPRPAFSPDPSYHWIKLGAVHPEMSSFFIKHQLLFY